MNGRTPQMVIAAAIAFVFMMLGTRLPTLSFGKVFAEQRPEDKQMISQLNDQLDALRHENEAAIAKSKEMEAASESAQNDLRQALAQLADLRARPPEVILEPLAPVAPPPASTPKKPSANAKRPSKSTVVHRGDTKEVVRTVFGRPDSVSVYGSGGERWEYGVGFKYVEFDADGHVVEWRGLEIEP